MLTTFSAILKIGSVYLKTPGSDVFSFGGIRPLHASEKEAETALGVAAHVTGGHPNGARIWQIPGSPLLLYADGFDSVNRPNDKSYLIFELTVGAFPDLRKEYSKDLPPIRPNVPLGFWTTAVLREKKPQLLADLKRQHVFVKPVDEGIVITPTSTQRQPHVYVRFLKGGRIDLVDFSIYSASEGPNLGRDRGNETRENHPVGRT